MKNMITVFIVMFTILSTSAQKHLKVSKLSLRDSAQIKQEVRQHIEKIFQAFVNKDTTTIRNLHSENWMGFQQFSRLKKNRESYMEPLRKAPPSMIGYHIDDYEIQIFSDAVLAWYEATIRNKFQGKEVESQLKSVDIYQKINGEWLQVGSHIASKITFQQFVQMMQQSAAKN